MSKIGTIDKSMGGFFVQKNWKCYDFELICVNSIKEVYLINKVFGHYIFKKRDEK